MKPIPFNYKARIALLLAICVQASSCGWVDSTGNSAADSTLGADFGTAPASDGVNSNSVIDIEELRIVQLLENNTVRVTPGGVLSSIVDWNWTPAIQNSANPDCSGVEGFDEDLAGDTLPEACTDSSDCELSITHASDGAGRSVFDVSIPRLRAPIGLSYRLTAYDQSGQVSNEYYSFCGIAINEAPEARDDIFTVVRGNTLVIRANDPINLLTNDTDDDDSRNQALRVDPTPASGPRFAENFRLQTNGGFLYTAPLATPAQTGATGFDSFVYEVSDGLHQARATVTLRIVNTNNAPTLVARINTITISVGQQLADDDPGFDLAKYFRDPDDNPMRFTAISGSLPESENIQLTEQGQLTGQARAADVGDYNVTIVASDGSLSATESFTLSIQADPSSDDNTAPVITPIDDLIVEAGSRFNTNINAIDADGDRLQYSLSSDTADFVSINRNTGRVSGFAGSSGIFPITVIVSDTASSSTRTFLVRVINGPTGNGAGGVNLAPEVDDISNAVFDDDFEYDVSGFFTDPENDPMTFTAVNLPPGVNISREGVVSGSPGSANVGPHFIVVTATDGINFTDDAFLLTLL